MHHRYFASRLGKLLNISHISISAGMNSDSFVCHLVSCGWVPTSQLRTLHCRLGRFDLLHVWRWRPRIISEVGSAAIVLSLFYYDTLHVLPNHAAVAFEPSRIHIEKKNKSLQPDPSWASVWYEEPRCCYLLGGFRQTGRTFKSRRGENCRHAVES